MKQLFKTSDDKIFTFSTNKYNLNSVSFCFTFQVNHNNAAHLSILDEFTKDHLRKNISSTYPISIYTQVLKKDKLFLFLIYFQYPRGLDNYRILNVSYLEIIANNIQKLINLNEKNCSNFEYYKQLAIRKVIAFENDIKTKAIKECFEILEDNYVTLYGQKEKIQDINQGSFIQWFSKSILCQDIQKQAFLLGTYSVLDEILISDSIPDSKRYEPSRNRQKIFESPIYIERNIESKIGFLVIALQVQEYESYSKKAISFLGEYLGGGGFSILFNIVREQKKLVYQIGTTTNVNKGEIIITAKVSVKENSTNIVMPGTAHLLEHIVLNDNNYNFFVEFMNLGARCNGYTHLSSTVFNIEMADFNFKTLDKFLEHIIRPEFDEILLEKQKKIVISEINSRASFPPLVNVGLKKVLKQEYNYFSVIGTKSDIEQIQLQELKQIKKYIYHPSNINLVTFGPKSPIELSAWFEDFSTRNSKVDNNIKLQRLLELKNLSDGVIVSNHAGEIVIVLKDEIVNNTEMIKKEVIMNLFIELIKEQVLTSHNDKIRYHIDYFGGLGITIVILNFDKDRLYEISQKLFKPESIINNLAYSSLDIIKHKILGQFIGSFDYPDRISNKLHWLFRNETSPEEYTKLILNMSIEEIKEYSYKLFNHIRKEMVYPKQVLNS